MDRLVTGGVTIEGELLLPAQQRQLAMDITPLPHAHPRQELLFAVSAELVVGQFLPLLLEVIPQVQQSNEVGFLVGPLGVGLVRRLLLVLGRSLGS